MPIITDTLATLTTRRDEIETEIGPQLAELNEINAVIKAIEKQQGTSPTTATGPRAARGENRDRILAAIASEAKTTAAICDETHIGRGSAARTIARLVDDGDARRIGKGYIAVQRNPAA
jgi:predicted HTH transcriptional regulator